MIKDAIGTPIEIGDEVGKATTWGSSVGWARGRVSDLLPDKTMSVEIEFVRGHTYRKDDTPTYKQKVRPQNVIVVNRKGMPFLPELT